MTAFFPGFCRTARADNQGTALSFISHTELPLLVEVEEALSTGELLWLSVCQSGRSLVFRVL